MLKKSWGYFLTNPVANIVLGLMSGLIIGGLTAVTSLLTTFFSVLIIPLIILPFMFAITNCYIDAVNNKQITAKGFFLAFRSFFSTFNISVFRFWRSILFSLLFYLGSTLIFSPIGVGIAYSTNTALFNEMINEISTNIEAVLANITAFYEKYYNVISIFIIFSGFIPGSVFATILFFNLSVNSMTIYTRRTRLGSHFMWSLGWYTFFKENRFKFYRNYLKLNWPLYILLISGFTGAYFLATYLDKMPYIYTFGFLLSFGASSLYMPIYYSNMMALTINYLPEMIRSYNKSMKDIFSKPLESPSNIPDADKEKIQQLLDTLPKESDEQDEQE